MQMSSQLHALTSLPPHGKSPWYTLDRKLGGTQRRSGRGGEEETSQLLPGLEPPIIQPVAQSYNTELPRLSHTVVRYELKIHSFRVGSEICFQTTCSIKRSSVTVA
jgi:hypothetical protein